MKNILKGFAIFIVLLIGAALFALSHQIGGWRAFIVSSGSMEPSILTGSVVLTQYTHPTSLQKNDVITFLPPIKNREFVTHRITNITRQKNVAAIKTKGDGNKNDDNWLVAGGAVVGKVIYTIPYLGFFFSFTQTKLGVLFFILLPAVYIIIDEWLNIVRMIKHHKKHEKPEAALAACLFFMTLSYFAPQPTSALLSDSISITSNNFAVAADCQSHMKSVI